MDLFAAYESAPQPPRPRCLADVRPAVDDDAQAIAGFLCQRHGGDVGTITERTRTEIASTGCLDTHALFAAEVDGSIVGFGRARHWTPGEDAPAKAAPPGWYLMGVIVDAPWRRRGVGHALTAARMDWIAERSDEAWYFVNARNRASVDLHACFGFREVTRAFVFPGVTFEGGVGVLFRAALPG